MGERTSFATHTRVMAAWGRFAKKGYGFCFLLPVVPLSSRQYRASLGQNTTPLWKLKRPCERPAAFLSPLKSVKPRSAQRPVGATAPSLPPAPTDTRLGTGRGFYLSPFNTCRGEDPCFLLVLCPLFLAPQTKPGCDLQEKKKKVKLVPSRPCGGPAQPSGAGVAWRGRASARGASIPAGAAPLQPRRAARSARPPGLLWTPARAWGVEAPRTRGQGLA